MSFQALARTWRPRRFDQLVGQDHVVRALTHALDADKLHHALLFSGTRGVGKTTIGRIIAKCLNCEHGVSAAPCAGENACATCREIDEGRYVDLIEVDAASRTGVDDTRELMDNVQYAPTRGRTKVYLIDEVHMLTKHSFNALLKTLEEPPPRVQFLLATTEPEKIPVTILSRCLQFPLKRLSAARIRDRLAHIVSAESLTADEPALLELARAADGSMRDGLSLLDQAVAFGGGQLDADGVRDMLGTIGDARVAELVDAIIDTRATDALAALEALYAQGLDMRYLLEAMATAWQHMATIQVVGEPIDDTSERWQESAKRLSPELTQLFYDITIAGNRDYAYAPDPLIAVRMCVLRMLAFVPDGHRAQTPSADDSAATQSSEARPASGPAGTPRKPAGSADAPRLSAREAMAQARAQLAGKTAPAEAVSTAKTQGTQGGCTEPKPGHVSLSPSAAQDPTQEPAPAEVPVAATDNEKLPDMAGPEEPPWHEAREPAVEESKAESGAPDEQPQADNTTDIPNVAEAPMPARSPTVEEAEHDDAGDAPAVPDDVAAEADAVASSDTSSMPEDAGTPSDVRTVEADAAELAAGAITEPVPETVEPDMFQAGPAGDYEEGGAPAAGEMSRLEHEPVADDNAHGLDVADGESRNQPDDDAEPANPITRDNRDHPEDWHIIVPTLDLSGFAAQLANNGRCQHLDNEHVELELAQANRFLATDDAKAQLCRALATAWATENEPRLVVNFVDALNDTPARRSEADAEKRQQDAVASIENDPMIRQLRSRLGAQLRIETIKPHRRPPTTQQRDEP